MRTHKIHMVKTYYPHWGSHTAFNSYVDYFDNNRFKITIQNVPMGDHNYRLPIGRDYWRKKIKRRKTPAYGLNDLTAEMVLFFRSLWQRYDLLHIIDGEHGLMFLPQWFRKYGYFHKKPKIVAMFHQPPAILETLINREIVKQLDGVQVVSPDQEEYFKRYMPPEKVRTILLGVDTEYFRPERRERTKIFKCLGGGVWLRDYDALVKTAEKLKHIPEIQFHIVAPQIPERLSSVPGKVGSNIIFHCNIADEELLEQYRTSDIVFLPMKAATANTFLLEACACGQPVVSTDIPSIRTYFPGQEAILVKNNDPEIFAAEIQRLYREPGRRELMSKSARERALELSWKVIVKQHEDYFQTICGRKKHR
jgi:glycosyltransferase involved in cell wall biosynthesis